VHKARERPGRSKHAGARQSHTWGGGGEGGETGGGGKGARGRDRGTKRLGHEFKCTNSMAADAHAHARWGRTCDRPRPRRSRCSFLSRYSCATHTRTHTRTRTHTHTHTQTHTIWYCIAACISLSLPLSVCLSVTTSSHCLCPPTTPLPSVSLSLSLSRARALSHHLVLHDRLPTFGTSMMM